MIVVLIIFSIVMIISVFITLIRNDYWIYRVLEYPRLQKLVLVLLALACWFFYWPLEKTAHQILFGGLCLSVLYLVYKIFPYTVFASKEMIRIPSEGMDNELIIFSANVYQENKQYGRMLNQIKAADPDLIFLLETSTDWADALKELEQQYPYTLLQPLENTYGLLFYSRLPLEEAKVNYLVKDDVPSIEATVQLRSGNKVKLWGVHPEPPVPGENLYSTAKDKELMKIALKVKTHPLPSIVIGDFNDVAWSHTTELFRKTSELLDPRRGRGFYSTFSAHNWFIRFPLDYIFCSREFGLINMKRLPKNGSDHFATVTHIRLQPNLVAQQPPSMSTKEDLEEAKEMASQEVQE